MVAANFSAFAFRSLVFSLLSTLSGESFVLLKFTVNRLPYPLLYDCFSKLGGANVVGHILNGMVCEQGLGWTISFYIIFPFWNMTWKTDGEFLFPYVLIVC